jgi:hypothetical protein
MASHWQLVVGELGNPAPVRNAGMAATRPVDDETAEKVP